MNNKSINSIYHLLSGMQQSINTLPKGDCVNKSAWSSYQEYINDLVNIDSSCNQFKLVFLDRHDNKKWVTKNEYVSKLTGLISYLSSLLNKEEKVLIGFQRS